MRLFYPCEVRRLGLTALILKNNHQVFHFSVKFEREKEKEYQRKLWQSFQSCFTKRKYIKKKKWGTHHNPGRKAPGRYEKDWKIYTQYKRLLAYAICLSMNCLNYIGLNFFYYFGYRTLVIKCRRKISFGYSNVYLTIRLGLYIYLVIDTDENVGVDLKKNPEKNTQRII